MSALYDRLRSGVSAKAIFAVILLMIFGVALSIRVALPYDSVFVGDWIRFGQNDPWYHMRVVENLVQHFPQRITFDPFTLYPSGQHAPFAPFFDLLLGFFIWLIGLGSPTQHTIELVGAYFPAVLGALVTVPVYFIGRTLFNRAAGLLAAGLIAILPGEFLFRSLLGFTDHHVVEVLFSTIIALFLILAIRKSRANEPSFSDFRHRRWVNLKYPLIYGGLAGLVLGMYLLSWVGALLLVFIIFVYLVIQYVIDHLWGRSTDYLGIIALPAFLIALVMVAPCPYPPYPGKGMVIAALVIGLVALVALSAISRLMAYRQLRRVFYPVALVLLGLAGLGVLYAVAPDLFLDMARRFTVFTPSTAARTISEVQPLLSQAGGFTLGVAWHYFTTGFYVALVALGLLVYAAIRERSAEKTFIIIWSLIMLVASLGQRRFGYYYAVNVALLSGYLSWRVIAWSILDRAKPQAQVAQTPADRKRTSKKRKPKKGKEPRRPLKSYLRYLLPLVASLVVFFGVFYPNIPEAVAVAENPPGPNESWHSALVWMRDNTADPFGDPDVYYEIYDTPPDGELYQYPESAYGVMSWWDYGHWITRIAHRIPNTNPFQRGIDSAARFFTAQDEPSASEVLDGRGSRYVIIDYAMATSKFYAMPTWIGLDTSQFYETYYEETTQGQAAPRRLYHPDYYRSMCARLYNFAGQQWDPDEWIEEHPEDQIWAISFEEIQVTDVAGNAVTIKLITDKQLFSTYSEAEAFVNSHDDYRIVGTSPFVSPVPLEEMDCYSVVYDSSGLVQVSGEDYLPYVRILEYSP
ncbi:MAG: oligosaccharyl transferase, archaeosortase A system-associated [Chloroflexota bacterium]|nr:oligosaccharyl transferase, archaeosortase A system-associated [Chloroflexota bacterium]